MSAIFGAQPISNQAAYDAALAKYNLKGDQAVSMLPYAGGIGKEIRHLYFQLALGEDGLFRTTPQLSAVPDGEKILHHLQVTRLFSFGECNAFCPYCKRDMQFLDDDGCVIASDFAPLQTLFEMAEGAVGRGEVVRFSGGDPVLFPKICMAIGDYVKAIGGKGVSIAHNGSGVGFVRNLLPLMSSAAIDIKAPRRFMGGVLGLPQRDGEKHFDNSLRCQALFHSADTNPAAAVLDVRTPVFGAHPDPLTPQTSLSDMMELADYITSNNEPRRTFWTWRMYKPVKMCDWNAPDLATVLTMMRQVSAAYPKQWMGIRAKWHGGGMVYCLGGEFINYTHVDTAEATGSGNTGECVTLP